MDSRVLQKQKAGFIATALCLSASGIISPILSNIGASFPEAGTARIQAVFSVISLAAIPFLLMGGMIARKGNKKVIVLAALLMIAGGGICGFAGYRVLPLLYLASALIGSGVSLGQSMMTSLMADTFDAAGRAKWGGICGAVFSVTGILLTKASGIITDQGTWRNAYLTTLYIIPLAAAAAYLLRNVHVPGKEAENKTTAAKPCAGGLLQGRYIVYVALGFAYMIVANGYNTNVSRIVAERGFGMASQAGTALAFSMFAGIPSGLLCGFLFKKLHRHYMTAVMLIITAGFITCRLAGNLPVLCVGSFLYGLGNGFRMPGVSVIISELFTSETNAMGIALFNVACSLGGFLSPFILGLVPEGNAGQASFVLSVCAVIALVLAAAYEVDARIPDKKV